MKHIVLACSVLALVNAAACYAPTDAVAHPVTPNAAAAAARSASPKDPTATWSIPLADAALALRSDGQFGNGASSVYADGVCNVSTRIFATTASSPTPSGDAILQTTYPKGKGCGRTVIMTYPDGGADTLATFSNLNKLQSPDPITVIPVGQTQLRRLIVGFGDILSKNPTQGRCRRVIFGDNGQVGAGTDMLLVTRVDAATWHIQSQPAPNNRALCENLGAIYDGMNVDLLIVASFPLPS